MKRTIFALMIWAPMLTPSAALAARHALGTDLVAPGTPYSPGLLSNGTLYISGLQGTDPKTRKLPPDFDTEARNCLENVGRVLKQGGMTYADVATVNIYLTDMSQFAQVNALYKRYFRAPYPARTTVQVKKLSLGARIEISATANNGGA